MGTTSGHGDARSAAAAAYPPGLGGDRQLDRVQEEEEGEEEEEGRRMQPKEKKKMLTLQVLTMQTMYILLERPFQLSMLFFF